MQMTEEMIRKELTELWKTSTFLVDVLHQFEEKFNGNYDKITVTGIAIELRKNK